VLLLKSSLLIAEGQNDGGVKTVVSAIVDAVDPVVADTGADVVLAEGQKVSREFVR